MVQLKEQVSAERERVKNAEEDDRRMRKYVLRYNARSEQKVRVCDEQVVFHSFWEHFSCLAMLTAFQLLGISRLRASSIQIMLYFSLISWTCVLTDERNAEATRDGDGTTHQGRLT